jgi:hypothetical protein
MLKRLAVLGVVGVFLAAPPAIAKSSSSVQAPAAKSVDQSSGRHSDGQCPFRADASAV